MRLYYKILKIITGIQSTLNKEIYYYYKLKKLCENGLKIGKNTYIGENVFFDPLYPYLISIGSECRIASNTLILAHDATTFHSLGVTRLSKVEILDGTFIGANCIILPGCKIGPNAMIAAGSVVNRDIGPGQAAAGNPARPYGKYEDIIEKYRNLMDSSSVLDKVNYKNGLISKKEILSLLNEKFIFMKGQPEVKGRVYGWF